MLDNGLSVSGDDFSPRLRMLVKDLPVTSDVDILDPLGIDPFKCPRFGKKTTGHNTLKTSSIDRACYKNPGNPMDLADSAF